MIGDYIFRVTGGSWLVISPVVTALAGFASSIQIITQVCCRICFVCLTVTLQPLSSATADSAIGDVVVRITDVYGNVPDQPEGYVVCLTDIRGSSEILISCL
jgi:hypothetical protein